MVKKNISKDEYNKLKLTIKTKTNSKTKKHLKLNQILKIK